VYTRRIERIVTVGDDPGAGFTEDATLIGNLREEVWLRGRLRSRVRAGKAEAADFQSCHGATTSPQSNGLAGARYTVLSYVDSQNSFGAKLRNNYIAVVQYEGYNETKHQYDWTLVSLAMDGYTDVNPKFEAPAAPPTPPATERRVKKQ
jgi:hypothetical protein